jgi:hypothetical protein
MSAGSFGLAGFAVAASMRNGKHENGGCAMCIRLAAWWHIPNALFVAASGLIRQARAGRQ